MSDLPPDRIILHCDLNSFYASVECKLCPELRLVPMAVAGNASARHGVILAKNDLAKKLGVKTGEAIWEAKRKAPSLVCVLPRHGEYARYSKLAFDLYSRFTPQVEPFGSDECWLDVSGCTRLFGSGKEIADKIREATKRELGLSVSVGVSYNKIFAKMGSDYKKPDATTEITRDNYQKLLFPLPVQELFMVGGKTAEKLLQLNIKTIGDLAAADSRLIESRFGIMGAKIQENARGENLEEVRYATDEREEKSIGHGLTTQKDLNDYKEADMLIVYLCELVAVRLRKKGFKAGGVSLDIKYNTLSNFTRQCKLDMPTCASADLSKEASRLLHGNWNCTPPIRALTVTALDLSRHDAAVQTSMFGTREHDKTESLEKAIDAINKKYGAPKVQRAALIKTDYPEDHDED